MGKSEVKVSSATIEELYRQAQLVEHALDGLLAMARDSRPPLGWDDELTPVAELAGKLLVTIRDLYVASDPDARQEAARVAEATRALYAFGEDKVVRRAA